MFRCLTKIHTIRQTHSAGLFAICSDKNDSQWRMDNNIKMMQMLCMIVSRLPAQQKCSTKIYLIRNNFSSYKLNERCSYHLNCISCVILRNVCCLEIARSWNGIRALRHIRRQFTPMTRRQIDRPNNARQNCIREIFLLIAKMDAHNN